MRDPGYTAYVLSLGTADFLAEVTDEKSEGLQRRIKLRIAELRRLRSQMQECEWEVEDARAELRAWEAKARAEIRREARDQ